MEGLKLEFVLKLSLREVPATYLNVRTPEIAPWAWGTCLVLLERRDGLTVLA